VISPLSEYARTTFDVVSAAGTVLVYHAIADLANARASDALSVSAAAFERQMSHLARRRTVVDLESFLAGSTESGRPVVALTFDDGFRSVLTTAAPILRRFGFPATIFVSTRWLDEPRPGAGDEVGELDLLTVADVQELRALGFEIGSHGHTHADLGRLGRPAVETELQASVDRLTELLGERPRYLAWPYGHSSTDAAEAAEAAGFEAAFTTGSETSGRFAVARIVVGPSDGATAFALKTGGHTSLVRRARSVPVLGSLLGAREP
jgi:peptidoglycan/xylan/chitin deacetylase (PgdA/CDA1 family)